jgi:hypothetical protein
MNSLQLLIVGVGLSGSGVAQELYRIPGEAGSQLGFSVRRAGDVDLDGVEDFICGRPYWQLNHAPSRGAGALVFSGADGALLLSLGEAEVGVGFAVDGVGDVDGDMHADVVVGSCIDSALGVETGAARVYSGADGTLLHTFFGTAGSFFGSCVAGVGDVDGDGVPDVAVGGPLDSTQGPARGRVEVLSGLDGRQIHVWLGTEDDAGFGSQVAAAGDLDSDGFADVCVGIPWSNAHGPLAGSLRIYSGGDGSVLREFAGEPSHALGVRLWSAGDTNGDGVGDLIVGYDILSSISRGRARVISGADGSVLISVVGDSPGDQIGRSVGAAGDFNGDGFGDVIVGGIGANDVAEQAGIASVYSGLDGSKLAEWHGESSFQHFGWSACGIGDVDGDGRSEVVVAAGHRSDGDGFSGLLRVMSSVVPAPSAYCFADQSSFACPCANDDAGAGCANSTGAGAALSFAGSQSLAAGRGVLHASVLPAGTFALLFTGTARASVPLGDGWRCVGGHLRRLVVFQADTGGGAALGAGEPTGAVAGTIGRFQVWYRDVAGACGGPFNLSNAVEIPWLL